MVRVRFAPSPTGYLHIGNARTALFNWLFAHHNNGSFILRIEDTDMERSSKASIEGIMADLRWLGLNWNEGPDKGGEFGPYLQSLRKSCYKKYLDKLLDMNMAYYCYCQPEELKVRRESLVKKGLAPRYDNRCRLLTDKQIADYRQKGIRPAIRFKVPEGKIIINDLVRGDVEFDSSTIGDFIIAKQDGMPSFNFAVSIDDALMEITHVIRGEDHLSNTPKHIMIFNALGFKLPQFAHLSMILGADGHRLSKRFAAVSVSQYRKDGYLPEALNNYLALLGWSSKTGKDLLSINDIIKEFDIINVNKSSAIFNIDKLNWMSGNYIRSADLQRITNLAIPYIKDKGFIRGEIDEEKYEWLKQIIDSVRGHLNCISEVINYVEMFFNNVIGYNNAELNDKLSSEIVKRLLLVFADEIRTVSEISEDNFKMLMKNSGEKAGVKGRDLFMPIRYAMTGLTHGPELTLIAPILGKERILKRLELIKEKIK